MPRDLARPDAAQRVVDETLAAFGRIDALLNIAGAVPQIDLFDMTARRKKIAEFMAFLVSPAARWMTGSAPRMDGGEVKSV